MYGRRERDLANRYFPRDAHAQQLPFTLAESVTNLASMNWETLAFIRRQWKGPLSIKGILSAKMAQRAVEAGANVIHISNHGGRQLDFAPGTVTVLPEIVKAVGAHADVVIDSGFVRGSDVVKAIALGAKAVLIGKMQAWSLAAAGPDGLLRALQLLQVEMSTTMGLLGATTVAGIRPDMVRPGHPARLPSVTSAFPYIN
jgi:isopentenyl diphosphate isomerase/L-lactate dehydrogenase-like FMN-dependent dehydrogenase